MGIFDKFVKTEQKDKLTSLFPTTFNFHIGVSEAEGEAYNSPVRLDEVFVDYLEIKEKLNGPKYIITGRKGSGKSAFGEHLMFLSDSDGLFFAQFIKKSDIDLEKIVQIGQEAGEPIKIELIYEWLILIKILTLIRKTEPAKYADDYKQLDKFFDRNRGFIELHQNEIQEVIKTSGAEIFIEYFKRFFKLKTKKELLVKETKAPFYKLIPFLKELLINLLSDEQIRKCTFVLLLDDLDINFKTFNEQNKNALLQILRTTKELNNSLFARYNFNVKVILLLRDDIFKHYLDEADTGKVFSAYELKLNWYEDYDFKFSGENSIHLKQFIDSRIKKNFEKNNIEMNAKTPWDSLISQEAFSSGTKSSFKYVLDHTFFRPRDLILYFKDLSDYKFDIPLSKDNVNQLLGKYAQELKKELFNELSATFKYNEIVNIFRALSSLNYRDDFSISSLESALSNYSFENDVKFIINELFEYSIIGNCLNKSDFKFKFREKLTETVTIQWNEPFVVHYGVRIFLD
ncbi:MAG: hypothetical protein PHQ74_10985 [Crocinitomicaceae bacterium]|nr:hypothetical protein [Crocinitomicaceae bacterium]